MKGKQNKTNQTYFNNLIGRLTYEKGHLNLGKTRNPYKTNPSQLRSTGSAALATRENKRETGETSHQTSPPLEPALSLPKGQGRIKVGYEPINRESARKEIC